MKLALLAALLLHFSCAADRGGISSEHLKAPPPDFQPVSQATPVFVPISVPTPQIGEPEYEGEGERTFFKFENDKLHFAPSAVVSIVIYEGQETNYAKVLVEKDPIASVPPPLRCKRSDGLCLESPLDQSECKGCEKLIKETTYTAFLFTKLSQPAEDVTAIAFKY